jgi:hypothetical protein
MFYVLDAPSDTSIPTHAHSGDVFRYILEGDFAINGQRVEPGTWMVVRKGTAYRVHSDTGYKAIVAYQNVCEVTGG